MGHNRNYNVTTVPCTFCLMEQLGINLKYLFPLVPCKDGANRLQKFHMELATWYYWE